MHDIVERVDVFVLVGEVSTSSHGRANQWVGSILSKRKESGKTLLKFYGLDCSKIVMSSF